MPLVRVSLVEGKSGDYKMKIGDVIHHAMVDKINCPQQDRFQLFTEHSKENFFCTPEYLGIKYSDNLIIIQITLNEGRSVELKKSLFQAIANGLRSALSVDIQDVFINLIEVKKENWSFGNGVAQYAS